MLAILSIMPYSVLPEEESHGLKQVALQIFVINCGEGSNIYRLSSIYWEPGQLQIVIFFVLMLFADELADLTKVRDNTKVLAHVGGLVLYSIYNGLSDFGNICIRHILFWQRFTVAALAENNIYVVVVSLDNGSYLQSSCTD